MKKFNRSVQLAVGTAILLLSGVVYAWSVLSVPISRDFPHWSKTQLSLTFTIVMLAFCIGSTVGGVLQKRLSVRKLLRISAVLFLGGFLLCTFAQTLLSLYLGFGVLCGIASGLSYNVVLGTINQWYPDKPGLSSGTLLMGFGLSSFFIGLLYQAMTPARLGGWRISFAVMGGSAALILLLCSQWLSSPPQTYVLPEATRKSRFTEPAADECTPAEMLRLPSFWLYFFWAILLSAAGLAFISQGSGIVSECASGLGGNAVAAIVGMTSAFNGIGRVIFGSGLDRLGRAKIMRIINLAYLFTALLLTAALKTHLFLPLLCAFMVGGLAYGGVNPMHAYFVRSYYGSRHYPMNFSIVISNLLVASFGSTVAGAMYDRTLSYLSTFLMMGVCSLAGAVLSLAIDRCTAGKSKRAERNDAK